MIPDKMVLDGGAGQHAAKAIERLLLAVDGWAGRTAPATAPHGRISTYVNLVGGAAAVFFGRKLTPTTATAEEELLTEMGWHMTTKAWDYAQEYLGIPIPAGSQPRGMTPPTGQQPPPSPARGRVIMG